MLKLWRTEEEEMKKTRMIGLGRIAMVIFIIAAAAVMAGCASTTYLVERDKWPAFDTLIVEDVKVAEGVEMPADALVKLNDFLFAKLSEDFHGKYNIVHNTKNSVYNGKSVVISTVVVKWYKVFNEIAVDITGYTTGREVFKVYSPLAVGLIYSKEYLLKWAAVWASRRIGQAIEN